jgi:hypothetical protein
MVEDPLELARGGAGLTHSEVRQSANIDGVQAAEVSDEADAPEGEIVARGSLQRLNCRCRIVSVL